MLRVRADWSVQSLSIGLMTASFHLEGTWRRCQLWLKIARSVFFAAGPICRSIPFVMPPDRGAFLCFVLKQSQAEFFHR